MRLLLRPLHSTIAVTHTILRIKLHLDRMIAGTTIQCAALDASRIRHQLQLGVQARSAIGAEEMLVNLPGCTHRVVRLYVVRALGDLERGARYHDVGGVAGAGPFLAVGAVAEGGGQGFSCGMEKRVVSLFFLLLFRG